MMDDEEEGAELGGTSIRGKIHKYADQIRNGHKVGHALKKLESVPMSFDLLSETGIGKIVNGLRSNERYSSRAQDLVDTWREVAKRSMCNEDEEAPNNVSSYASSSTNSNKTSTGLKRKQANAEPMDAFAAQLAAADNIRPSIGLKKKKATGSPPPRITAEEIGRSLLRDATSTNRYSAPRQQPATSNDNAELDASMFKARKGAMNKVYAGRRKAVMILDGKVPSLFDTCMKVCLNNIDAIEETGDIPFDILKPILEKCSDSQLSRIESKNRYLEEDSDYLWARHCSRVFPGEEIQEDEPWKHCFVRLTEERERRLKRLSESISRTSREAVAPVRKAMMADPIAPRDARRRQIKNGLMCSANAVPSAIQLSKSRRKIFENGNDTDLRQLPKAVRNTNSTVGGASSSSSRFGGGSSGSKKPAKRGALMVKTLKMLKGRPR